VRKEKKKGEPKTYHWTLLGQHTAAVTFGSAISIALVVGSSEMLVIADGNVNSLRGSRGNIVVDISVFASVVLVIRSKLKLMMMMMMMIMMTTMPLLLLLLRMLVLMTGCQVLPQLLKVWGLYVLCLFLGF
jgi:hypothetical protein